jgi:hypothetical protein
MNFVSEDPIKCPVNCKLYSKEALFETYFVMFIVSLNIFEFALNHFR